MMFGTLASGGGQTAGSWKRGMSAYEVYVAEGGTLSRRDWLESLKGPGVTVKSISQIEEGTIVILEDVDGDHEFMVPRGEKGEPLRVTNVEDTEEAVVIHFSDGTSADIEKPSDGFSPLIVSEQAEGGYNLTITDADGSRTIFVANGLKGDQGDPGIDGREVVFVTDQNGMIYWKYATNDNNWKDLIDLGGLATAKYEEEFQKNKVVEIIADELPIPDNAKEGVLYILGTNSRYTAYTFVNGEYVQVMKPVASLIGENYNDLIDVPVIVVDGTTQYNYVNLSALDNGRYCMRGYYKWQNSDPVQNTGAEKMNFDVVIDDVTGKREVIYNTYENGDIYVNIVTYDGMSVVNREKKRLNATYWGTF